MPKINKTCIYSNKSKVLIVKSHQTCIYSKKQKIKNHRLYAGLIGVDELVFVSFVFLSTVNAGLATFHYQNFDFFEYMQVLRTCGIKMLIFWSICRFCAL